VAIASDGLDYLAVRTAQEGPVAAIALSHGGVVSEPRTVTDAAAQETGAPSLIHLAGEYVLAWRSGRGSEVRVVHLSGATPVLSETPITAQRFTYTSLAAFGGRPFLAWMTSAFAVHLRDLSNAADSGASVSYGAADQEILASATTFAGTLFVWSEFVDGESTLHGGVRSLAGDWSERPLLARSRRALAATNGSDFLVVARDDADWYSIRVGSNGRLLAPPTRLVPASSTITSVAWNGSTFVVAVSLRTSAFAAPVDGTGALGSSSALQPERSGLIPFAIDLASDGTSVVAAWLEPEPYYC
jgi:hypothetical protein